jgi:dolichyl-phosphate beta-glucosyltransferase
MSKPLLTIVIPAYNEAKNFRDGLLKPAFEFLHSQKFSWEILFVDDGSTDDTGKLLSGLVKNEPHTRLITIPHGGKAAAVTSGVKAASGDVVLFTDFDQSTPLSQVTKFLAQHKQGAGVCIGVRGGESAVRSDTLARKVRSWAFLKLVQIVALPGVQDSQCGFKSFTREAAKKVFSNLQVSLANKVAGGYMGAFDVEVLYLARKYNFSLSQIPVDWVKVPSEKLNVWREPLMMIRDTFKVRLFDLLHKYDSQTSNS